MLDGLRNARWDGRSASSLRYQVTLQHRIQLRLMLIIKHQPAKHRIPFRCRMEIPLAEPLGQHVHQRPHPVLRHSEVYIKNKTGAVGMQRSGSSPLDDQVD